MSGGKVEWRAEDTEAGAQRIAGRPAQAFWRRLRPCFRDVLLEPHRRAGDARVSWSWTGPAEPGVPGSGDLAGLRRRLGAGLANLAAELERDEEAGGGEAGELRAGMAALVADLADAPDGRLAAYAARTETGWMIRSWGVARPAPARRADETDADPVAGPAEESATQSAADMTVTAGRGSSTAGWRRLAGILIGLVALGAVFWFAWGMRAGRADGAEPGRKETVVVAEKGARTASTAGAETLGVEAPGSTAGNLTPVRSGPVAGPVFSGSGAPARRAGDSVPTETRLKVVPVPMAYTGPMATPPETEPRPGGVERDSTRGASAGPERTSSGPGGAAPPGKRPVDASGTVDEKKKTFTDDAPRPDAIRGAPDAKSEVALGDATQRVGDRSPVDVDRPASVAEPAGGATGTNSAAPDAPAGNTSAASGTGSYAKKADRVVQKTADAVSAGAVPMTVSQGVATDVASDRTWFCRLGDWRLARTRDVALATVPGEVLAEGDAAEALAAARRRAWEQVRAALPSALRRPVTRAGWVFRFKTESTEGKAAAAPTWVLSGEGERAARFSVASGQAELGWTEPASAGGIEARLVGSDGAEWARVRMDEAGRRIEVRAGAEVTEAAPWFEVLSGGAGEEPRAADECVWRSLRPGWSDTRWRSERSSESTRVACFPADPALTITDEGVIALEHAPGGWALAREVRLAPGP